MIGAENGPGATGFYRDIMSSRYNGPGNDGRAVPMRVARQLLEQRDRLVEEVQKARSEVDDLKSRYEAEQQQRRKAEQQVEQLRDHVETLREQLDDFEERFDIEDQEPESSDDDEREQLQRRAQRLSDDLRRVRSRTSDSVQAARREERIRLLSGLADVLDAVERAVEMSDASGPWRQGLEAIKNRFISYLKSEGVELIGRPGETMNPNLHQAISIVESDDVDANTIVDVERPGLVLEDGTVVRPAQVVVAK